MSHVVPLAAGPYPAMPGVATLDIEASGFGRASYPIEVGVVLPDGRAWCTLIRPAEGWTHWDPQAEQVHGISQALLQQHGRDVATVAQMLNDTLQGQVVYCDGWAHDYPWLGALFDAAGRVPRFRLESAAQLLDADGLPELPQAQREAMVAMGLTRHRASNDARALQQALLRLRHPRA